MGQADHAFALLPELIVSDIARSRDVYVQVLRFTLRYERPEEGFAFIEREGAQLMLDQRSTDPERDCAAGPLAQPEEIAGLDGVIDIPARGVTLPLAEVYRGIVGA